MGKGAVVNTAHGQQRNLCATCVEVPLFNQPGEQVCCNN